MAVRAQVTPKLTQLRANLQPKLLALKNKSGGGKSGGGKPPGGGGEGSNIPPRKPPIPDEEPRNLEEQIFMKDARNREEAGLNVRIQGGPKKPLVDAPRLVAHYGGKESEWEKWTGPSNFNPKTKEKMEVHYFRNSSTKQAVEWKFKRYPANPPQKPIGKPRR